MAALGTTGSHETKSSVVRSFLAQPRDVSRPIRSSYYGNDVFIIYLRGMSIKYVDFLNNSKLFNDN